MSKSLLVFAYYLMVRNKELEENSYFLFQITVSNKIDRNKLIHQLKDSGIGVSIHYAKPVPLMDYYKNKYGYMPSHFPNAFNYA